MAGNRTRSGYGRSLIEHRRRRRFALDHRHRRRCRALRRVNPARSAASGLTVKRTAGPLVVFSMPSSTSTIGVRAADRHLLERFGHLRRPRREQLGIRREQLHHDRLRRAGQVADHVLQHLDELDVEARLRTPLTFARDVADHLVDAAAARSAFSLTAMSPVFGSVTAARPSSRPVRRDVLSTSGVARRIDSMRPQHAVRLLQRAARRHHVVEHEPAFVERRQQVAAERAVAAHTTRRSARRTTGSSAERLLQRAAHRSFVNRAGRGRRCPPVSDASSAAIIRRSCAARDRCRTLPAADAPRRDARQRLRAPPDRGRISFVLRLLVQTSASTSDVSSETLIAIASALKNVPVTPVMVMSGRNTTIGVSVDPISGTVSSFSALAVACERALAAVAVQHDVLDDDDLVVDHAGRPPPRARRASSG